MRPQWNFPATTDTVPLHRGSLPHSILLKVRRAPVVQSRVQPIAVIEAFQVLEDRRPSAIGGHRRRRPGLLRACRIPPYRSLPVKRAVRPHDRSAPTTGRSTANECLPLWRCASAPRQRITAGVPRLWYAAHLLRPSRRLRYPKGTSSSVLVAKV